MRTLSRLPESYLARAIEDAGYPVDFRDYQLNTFDDP